MEDFANYWAWRNNGCYLRTAQNSVSCNVASGCAWENGQCYSTTSPDDFPGVDNLAAELQSIDFIEWQASKETMLRAYGRDYDADASAQATGWKFTSGTTGNLKLAWVSFNATIPMQNTVEEANTWYDRWEAFRKKYGESLGGMQTTELYVFMVTQNEMVKAAIMGIFLSLFVAFLVMVLTTQNWWTSLLGLVNIVAISVVFLGVMPIIGWSLGESECIFLIAVVGLSVDYTVHLLHSYNHAEGTSREERSKHALAEMGISVTNSAITTLLASVILFGCGFYFFFQFGGFIFFVIGFSILMSITFLIPLVLVAGPEGESGVLNFKACMPKKSDKVAPAS